ncbi:unnamed protein product [Aphanomyces euteiches]
MEIVAERKKPEDERLLKPLASQKFPLLGGNAVLEAIPRVVHFGGFRLNQTVTQKLRILNKSTASTRMHIVLPSEQPFHAENQRKGTIYPGMSEEIVVSFTPTDYKYYYDCVKVHSEAGNFIVPLHAYPVVNNVQFPAQVHFGTQPLGHRSTRVVAIECSVPIEFEFRINVLRAHTSITVEPLQGTIPPNSRAEITIAFQPIVMANVFSEIELMVSQFGFKPMTCTISGSSAPGLQVESQLTKLGTTIDTSSTSVPAATDEASSNDKPVKAKAKKTKRYSSPPRNPVDDLQDEDENDVIDGIKIPKKMEGVHATNFVLTQQPGKLKPKDLKRAIEANRALRKRQKAEQEALRQKTGSCGGRLSFDVLLMEESVSSKPMTRQLKELVFLQELQEIDKMEKELEFQSHRDSIGDSTLSQDDVQFIKDIRVYHAKERARHERETLRTTFKSHGSSAASTPPMRAALPAFHQPSHVPDFNPYKNDLWAKRKRILARFIQVVSKLVLRLRADRRLGMIKAWLGNASSRLEVRKMVDRDWRFAQVTTSNLSTPAKSQDPTADRIPISTIVSLHSFPLYAETDSRTRLPVAATTDIAFHNFDLFPLHVPLEANEMGYKPHPALVVPQYAPLEIARRLRVGAQYEAGVRLPRPISDAARAAADAIAGPVSPSELNWEYTVPKTFFCMPPATPRVYTPETWPTETDPEFMLQPEFFDLDLKLTRQQVLADTPGSISVAIKTPYMLHTAWLCRREHPMHPYTPLWELPPSAPSIIDTTQDHIPIDPLSDSESDNDEPSPESTLPTLDDARKLFEEHLDFDLKSLERFPRDEAYLKLDAEYTAYRYDLSTRLPLRMKEIAKHIKDPKMQFVLQGHGDPLPLHTFEPEAV